MLESTCDVVIIRAFNLELLDTGELLKERAPWNNLLPPGLKLEVDKQFLHGGKLCSKHAGYFPLSSFGYSYLGKATNAI